MGKYYKYKVTKSGYLLCVVPTCQTKKSTTALKTFEFPSDLKRRSQWISAIVDATLKNEEEMSPLEDLYAIENRRMELEMEVSGVLGDHSYVCAMHFLPQDVIVHPNVCRLSPNAIPSVFKNYPTELPRQFFKKICQTARDITDNVSKSSDSEMREDNDGDDAIFELSNIEDNTSDEISDFSQSNAISKYIYEANDPDYTPTGSRASHSESNLSSQKLKLTGSRLTKKKYRALELQYKNLQKRVSELENKLDLYNINSLEKDAENNNEEALFLLDMLRSYTDFERTRAEIMTSRNEN